MEKCVHHVSEHLSTLSPVQTAARRGGPLEQGTLGGANAFRPTEPRGSSFVALMCGQHARRSRGDARLHLKRASPPLPYYALKYIALYCIVTYYIISCAQYRPRAPDRPITCAPITAIVATMLRQRPACGRMFLGDACVCWPLTLSLTVPNEHAENTGTRKRRYPEEPPALDPLENTICALR